VSAHQDDWDPEERDALAGVEDQIETMRRRHAGAPPFDVLRAAQQDALPPELQSSVSSYIASTPLARTLAEGIGAEEPSLTSGEQARLLARVIKEAGRAQETRGIRAWFRPAMVGVSLVAIASIVWLVGYRTRIDGPIANPGPAVAVATPPEVPAFLLPIDKPDVKLSMAALTWRGSTTSDSNQLLADLKPGLDAYRQGDYAAANRDLSALASKYPGTIEILFYQGISRLFLNDPAGAIESLSAAEAVGDRTFAADIAWYRAVADERAGHGADARTRLEAVCAAKSEGAERACQALKQLPSSSSAPR